MDPAQLALVSLILSVVAVVVAIVAAAGTVSAARAARRENRLTERALQVALNSGSTVSWVWEWGTRPRWPPIVVVRNVSSRHRAFEVTVELVYGNSLGTASSGSPVEIGPQGVVDLELFHSRPMHDLAWHQRRQVQEARAAAEANLHDPASAFAFSEAVRLSKLKTRLMVRWKNSVDGAWQEWVAEPSPTSLWDVDSVPQPGRGFFSLDWPPHDAT